MTDDLGPVSDFVVKPDRPEPIDGGPVEARLRFDHVPDDHVTVEDVGIFVMDSAAEGS